MFVSAKFKKYGRLAILTQNCIHMNTSFFLYINIKYKR